MNMYTNEERLRAALNIICGIQTDEDLDILDMQQPLDKRQAVDVVVELFDELTQHTQGHSSS